MGENGEDQIVRSTERTTCLLGNPFPQFTKKVCNEVRVGHVRVGHVHVCHAHVGHA